jgi:hypothetical protein
MSVAQKHRIITPEHRAKITAALTGRKLSTEQRLRLSVIHKARRQKEKQLMLNHTDLDTN